jgi:hypothetical protein
MDGNLVKVSWWWELMCTFISFSNEARNVMFSECSMIPLKMKVMLVVSKTDTGVTKCNKND